MPKFVLLYWYWKAGVSNRFTDGTLGWVGTRELGEKCNSVLGMHTLSRCDNGKCNVSTLKVVTHVDITHSTQFWGEENATESDLRATGTAFFLALYNQKKSTGYFDECC